MKIYPKHYLKIYQLKNVKEISVITTKNLKMGIYNLLSGILSVHKNIEKKFNNHFDI